MPRLSVNINSETAAALEALAAKHGTNVTEIVRRSVSTLVFLHKEVDQKPNMRLQLVDSRTGERTNLHVLG